MKLETAKRWFAVLADAIALAELEKSDTVDLDHPDLGRATEMDDAARAELEAAIKKAQQ